MKVGDMVNVGGCVGKISDLDEVELTVSGVWHDYTEKPYREPWNMRFRIADLAGKWNDKFGEYDATETDPISY